VYIDHYLYNSKTD
jgi:hypothetical protein